ncbi:MAG: hypothetical protein WCZ98_03395 [Sideroxydans sp.]
MRKYLLVLLLMVATPSQVLAGVVGTQCWVDGKLVGGFPAGYTCPGTGGGRSGGGGSSSLDSSTYNGFYQLGYQFGQWLVGSGSNPQAELQKQQMMAELQRRQAEAERQHQEEEARRLAAMYNRLTATLKLSGLPNLQLKEGPNKNTGLKLKLGDGGNGQAGIKGLPGMYLNDDKKPYGIQGLPGIYTGGPGQESGLQNSELKLKLGDAAAGPNESQPPSVTGGSAQVLTTESGLQLKSGDSNAQPALFDPSKMTPQQLADVAEQVSRLTPEDQQRILALGQPTEGAIGQSSLQQQVDASRVAAGAVVPEDASAKARAGFDQPIGTAPVQLGKTGTTPTIPVPPRTATSVNRPPLATPAATEQSTHAPPAEDWIKLYLFPGEPSPATRVFPNNPNPPLTNPLRDEKKLQAELKAWDDWAVQHSVLASAPPEDELYPSGTEHKILNTSTVKQFAPQLLDHYNGDIVFRQRVDSRLQQINEKVAFDYYQELANAHKGALLDYQAELGKLAAAGKLDARIALEDQYRLHPARRQLVQSVWSRIATREQAALEQALANAGGKLDKEYRIAFDRILKDDALQH